MNDEDGIMKGLETGFARTAARAILSFIPHHSPYSSALS
jgi:hypothetical protein